MIEPIFETTTVLLFYSSTPVWGPPEFLQTNILTASVGRSSGRLTSLAHSFVFLVHFLKLLTCPLTGPTDLKRCCHYNAHCSLPTLYTIITYTLLPSMSSYNFVPSHVLSNVQKNSFRMGNLSIIFWYAFTTRIDDTRTENVGNFNVIKLLLYGQIALKMHCVLPFSVKFFRIDQISFPVAS